MNGYMNWAGTPSREARCNLAAVSSMADVGDRRSTRRHTDLSAQSDEREESATPSHILTGGCAAAAPIGRPVARGRSRPGPPANHSAG